MKSLTKYDTDLFYRLYKLTQKRDCRSIIWLSKTGDGYLYFVIGMLLWAFEPEHGELFLYTALMACTGASSLCAAEKNVQAATSLRLSY